MPFIPPMRFGYSHTTESQRARQLAFEPGSMRAWLVGCTEHLPGLTRRPVASPDASA